MDSLKAKLVEKIEHLPETELQEVLKYVDFLEWKKTAGAELSSEQLIVRSVSLPSEQLVARQPENVSRCPFEYVGGVLVVQSQGAKIVETTVQIREERIREFTSC